MDPLEQYDRLLQTHEPLFANQGAPFRIETDLRSISEFVGGYAATLRNEAKNPAWAQIGVVLDDPYVLVLRDLVVLPDGTRLPYLRLINRGDISGGKSVAVLPTMSNRILLLRHFRHATRSWHLEAPRGFGEPGIPATENARKEVREELGATITELIDLGDYHSNTGIEGHSVRLFFAHLRDVGTPAHNEGVASFLQLPVGDVKAMIRDGEITDGFTIAAFTRALLRDLLNDPNQRHSHPA